MPWRTWRTLNFWPTWGRPLRPPLSSSTWTTTAWRQRTAAALSTTTCRLPSGRPELSDTHLSREVSQSATHRKLTHTHTRTNKYWIYADLERILLKKKNKKKLTEWYEGVGKPFDCEGKKQNKPKADGWNLLMSHLMGNNCLSWDMLKTFSNVCWKWENSKVITNGLSLKHHGI